MDFRLFFLLMILLLTACGGGSAGTALPVSGDAPFAATPEFGFAILARFPHDATAFTQGLITDGNLLLEGTGGFGQSVLRRWDPQTGNVSSQQNLDNNHFGEGIARFADRIYQLTWKSQVLYVWDAKTLAPLARLSYQGDGWGLTSNGSQLIRSDGTDRLHFHQPLTFQETGSIQVKDGTVAVDLLNELEFIDGEIWANIWHSDRIARINPLTGEVTGWINLAGLATSAERGTATENVLNGIAFDPATGRILVTGKRWSNVFEITIRPR